MKIFENNEVELTEELMLEIVAKKKWGSVESLRALKEIGAKWNLERNSIVFETETF
ncbi:MAG: hypothetical protein ACOVNU_09900 [Candidatus Kapaibacteriota bacterium]